MTNNDFIEVLLERVNGLGLVLQGSLDYLDEEEGLVLYALPGGSVIKEDMAGTQTVSLPFELAIKTKSQEVANTTLWKINTALSAFDLDLPSQNDSYEFLSLEVAKPFLNDRDEQGFYVYMLDVTAKIEIERKF